MRKIKQKNLWKKNFHIRPVLTVDQFWASFIAKFGIDKAVDFYFSLKTVDENKKKFYDTADLISHTKLEGSANPKGYFYLHCNYTGNEDKKQPSSSN